MSGTEPEGDRPLDRTQPFRAPQRSLPDDLPRIPGITLQYEVARGGMGVVYGGRQDFLDRRVAVKLLSKELGGESFAQRFQREAKILAGIKHQNIVSCHLAGTTDDGQSYLVMEFIDGPSLKAWVTKNGPVSCAAALRTARGVAQALAHAHLMGVIHRDVKPENILLETVTSTAIDIHFPFTPKLVDLGLARMTEQTAGLGLTSPGSVMGTPATMSPEQFDDPDSVDFRTDIYGLGCALYEMLVGDPAFRSTKLTDIVMAKRSEVAPDPCRENPTIPAAVGALVQSMLATRREDRPSSYRELDEQIAAVLSALSSKGSTTRTMTDVGEATRVAMPADPTRPITKPAPPSSKASQPPKQRPDQPSGPGLLQTAEMDFLSAGAKVGDGSGTPQFVSSPNLGTVPATAAPRKGNLGIVLAMVAVVVLGGIAWAVFGRGGDDQGTKVGPGTDKPAPAPDERAPFITEIKGPTTVNLDTPFTLQAVAVAGGVDGGALSYSWTKPPQLVFTTDSSMAKVGLRILNGLPGVQFEVAVDVTDAKKRTTHQPYTITVGDCPEDVPLFGFKNKPGWNASKPSLWADVISSATYVSCRTEEGALVQTLQGPLSSSDYWEWSGLVRALDTDENKPFADIHVRFEFGDRGWAVHCTRDKSKPNSPWRVEVLEARRSADDKWTYAPLAAPLSYGWVEPLGQDGEPSDDEYSGWFSVQRRGGELLFAIGATRLPPGGKLEDVARQGPVSVPFNLDASDAHITFVVDQGIGRFDLRRR